MVSSISAAPIKIRSTAPNQTHCAKLGVRNILPNRINSILVIGLASLMLRVVAVPPMNRGAPCTMVNSITGAQECDATKRPFRGWGHQGRDDGNKKNFKDCAHYKSAGGVHLLIIYCYLSI